MGRVHAGRVIGSETQSKPSSGGRSSRNTDADRVRRRLAGSGGDLGGGKTGKGLAWVGLPFDTQDRQMRGGKVKNPFRDTGLAVDQERPHLELVQAFRRDGEILLELPHGTQIARAFRRIRVRKKLLKV